MSAEIITKEDLQVFRQKLLHVVKNLLAQKSDISDEWLKTADVRELLKISTGNLATLRNTGLLKYSKIGGTYYYRKRDLHHMIIKAGAC